MQTGLDSSPHRSLNALGALRKYEANRGSIDEYFDAGKLSEKNLLREGMRHAGSRKLDLFATDGWKQLIEELKENAFSINSVEAVKDENDMHFRKGQLNILAFVLNMESTVEATFSELKKEDA